MPVIFNLRKATLEDIPVLERLIRDSSRALGGADYTCEQIEAALQGAWGVDTELINDGTYFVADVQGKIAGCGGWGMRRTLFGGDGHSARQSELLDPSSDAARIRAFFVHPDYARQGIGRALLEKCEEEACIRGFQSAELIATLPGRRLYSAFGYVGDTKVEYKLTEYISIDFVPMRKELA